MGRWHAYYARRHGGEVAAVVDRDASRADALASRLRKPARRYADLASCLVAERLDVVHVCTPLDSHVELADLAVGHGTHALVEKPLAPSAGETIELLARAVGGGARVNPVHQFPFQRGVTRARDGRLGRLTSIEFTTFSAGGSGLDERGRRELLLEIAPHPLSLFTAFGVDLDEVAWHVDVATSSDLAFSGLDRDVVLRARIGLDGRPTRNELALVGDRATAHVDLFHGFSVLLSGRRTSRAAKLRQPFALGAKLIAAATGNGARRALAREPAYPGLAALIGAFYESVREGTPPPLSDQEIAANARAVDALRAATG